MLIVDRRTTEHPYPNVIRIYPELDEKSSDYDKLYSPHFKLWMEERIFITGNYPLVYPLSIMEAKELRDALSAAIELAEKE